jgi:hypothetical protein
MPRNVVHHAEADDCIEFACGFESVFECVDVESLGGIARLCVGDECRFAVDAGVADGARLVRIQKIGEPAVATTEVEQVGER